VSKLNDLKEDRMLIKTVLNRIHRFKRFVYGKVRFATGEQGPVVIVELRSRANSKPVCSGCQERRPGYDRIGKRRFEFVPLWGISVFFEYSMRRVDCRRCGIVVEAVPWANGKNRCTDRYAWFLARWAKRLSWKEVAEVFKSSWETVFRSVERAVSWGLEHRNLEGISAIGVDEISVRRGHRYLTLVYEISSECRRLLWMGPSRTKAVLHQFFDFFGEVRTAALKFICSDMSSDYLEVIGARAKSALNVLDRYHVIANLNKKIDLVRAREVKRLKAEGKQPVLKHSRWCVLKRPEHLTENQDIKLAQLLKMNLQTVRAYLLKEDFDFFWTYVSPAWAEKFLDRWCKRVMRSRIEPMKDFVKTLRAHKQLLLNWFKARTEGISLGAVEGLNNKAKVTTKRSYGFRTFRATQVALYHTLGRLPEPKVTHRFC